MAVVVNEALEVMRQDPRRAVTENEIVCLVCGSAFRQLTNTHLAGHGLSTAAYKKRFGYNRNRPLMCTVLVRLYTERAVEIRLADRIRRRPVVADPELRRQGGARRVVLEEYLTRSDIQRRPRRRWNARDESGRFSAKAQQMNTTQILGRAHPCSS